MNSLWPFKSKRLGKSGSVTRAEHISDLELDDKTLKYIRSYRPGAKEMNETFKRARKSVGC